MRSYRVANDVQHIIRNVVIMLRSIGGFDKSTLKTNLDLELNRSSLFIEFREFSAGSLQSFFIYFFITALLKSLTVKAKRRKNVREKKVDRVLQLSHEFYHTTLFWRSNSVWKLRRGKKKKVCVCDVYTVEFILTCNDV